MSGRSGKLSLTMALVGLIAAGPACTGDRVPDALLSPAPRECPTGLVHAGHLGSADLGERLRGYVPADLPSGFGLVALWGEGEGPDAMAMWADRRCREITILVWSPRRIAGDGPRVGPWTVTADAPRQCSNLVLGKARCLEYQVELDDAMVGVFMMGIDRDEGDDIVRSIPT